MRASILGLGQWLPETVRDNGAWPRDFGAAAEATELTDVTAGSTGDACDRIVARHVAAEHGDPFLGTRHRRVADATMTACEAEAHAARAALADAQVEPREVDVLLSWSLVPDHVMPASAPRVAHLIGASRALGMAADAACASSVTQLILAAALVESGQARCVVLTQSHLATRVFPLAHPASPNVGDAATAIVVGASEQPGILSTFGVSHGEHYDAVVWRRTKENDSAWHQPGTAMYMGSYARESARRLIQDTVRLGADTVREAATRANVRVSSLDAVAAVQPRRWVPGAIAEALGLPVACAPQTFDDLAHLGGCGVVTNLIAARRRAAAQPFLAALYAQGAGFTRAAAIVRLTA
jgi:3-oxoacyl-[acyl-carrier-protein] synthase-3